MPRRRPIFTNRLKRASKTRRIGPRGRKGFADEAQPVYVMGKKLNKWEATVWKALGKRGEDWIPQEPLSGGARLGGAIADFLSYSRKQIIEVDGPFHNVDAREFMRDAVRRNAGFNVVHIRQSDLAQIDSNLNLKLGY